MKKEYIIFISYRRTDPPSRWVTEYFYKYLEKQIRHYIPDTDNLKIFLDTKEITSGTLWKKKLKSSLARTIFFIPIISIDYFNPKKFTCYEFSIFKMICDEYHLYKDSISPIFPIVLMNKDELEVGDLPQFHDLFQTKNLPDSKIKNNKNKMENELTNITEKIVIDINIALNKNIPLFPHNDIPDDIMERAKSNTSSVCKLYKNYKLYSTYTVKQNA